MKKLFWMYRDDALVYRKVCKNGHMGPDGRNVKMPNRGCLACEKNMPPGPFTEIFTNVSEAPHVSNKKYFTKEESLAARSRASYRWLMKNKDKFKEYQEKYHSKPEIKEKLSIKYKENYKNLSEEEKERRRLLRIERYHKKKLEMTPEELEYRRRTQRERYYARKEKLNENNTVHKESNESEHGVS